MDFGAVPSAAGGGSTFPRLPGPPQQKFGALERPGSPAPPGQRGRPSPARPGPEPLSPRPAWPCSRKPLTSSVQLNQSGDPVRKPGAPRSCHHARRGVNLKSKSIGYFLTKNGYILEKQRIATQKNRGTTMEISPTAEALL